MVNDPQNDYSCAASGNPIDIRVVFIDKSAISAIKQPISWISIVYSKAKK
jgi:hypothetical protein